MRPRELKRGAIYEVPCGGCEKVYIGETGRNLQERLKEHKYTVKTANMNNGIVAHAWRAQHPVDWTSAKVRAIEEHLWSRRYSKPFTSNGNQKHPVYRLWPTTEPSMTTTDDVDQAVPPNLVPASPSFFTLIIYLSLPFLPPYLHFGIYFFIIHSQLYLLIL